MLKFVAIKYLSLALNASRSLVLAALLGPQSFGVLGTLIVVQQYLSYAALGMREGITVRLAQGGSHPANVLRSSALAWGLSVGLVIVIGLVAFDWLVRPLGEQWIWVGLIALLSIANEILINIHRDQNRLVKVALLEVVYNAVPLICALAFGSHVTVVLMLQSIAIGLVLSVASYLFGIGGLGWRLVSVAAVRQLLSIGLPMAVSAFFSASVTSIYVLVANAMKLGPTVGLIVFANSICMIVMYGSNMIAWAATSKSMRQLASIPVDGDTQRNQRLTYFFRIAVIVSALAVALSGPLVARFLPTYAGVERYALLFCLLQSSSLLLYVEMNFLTVKGRSSMIAAGYGAMLTGTLLVYAAVPAIDIVDLVSVGILFSMLVGVACAWQCHELGLRSASLRSQFVFLTFPLLCALAFRAAGPLAAAVVSLGFLGRALLTGRRVFLLKGAA